MVEALAFGFEAIQPIIAKIEEMVQQIQASVERSEDARRRFEARQEDLFSSVGPAGVVRGERTSGGRVRLLGGLLLLALERLGLDRSERLGQLVQVLGVEERVG